MTQKECSAYALAIGMAGSIAYLAFRNVVWYDLLIMLVFDLLITLAAFVGGYTTLAERLGIPDSALPRDREKPRN